MFEYLYSSIFPLLGEFFGKLVAVANLPYYYLINSLRYGGPLYSIVYHNLFTSTGGVFNLFQSNLISRVLELLSFGVNPDYPVWVVLLLSFLSVYLVVAIVKFLL